MAVKKFFLYGLLAILVSGCASGHSVTETLHIQDTPSASNVCATDKAVVLLPFADYSSGDDVMSVHARSRSITEALTDRFIGKGFNMPVQEDVTQYLVEAKIIKLMGKDGTSRMKQELNGEWSDLMKSEFQNWIDADNIINAAQSGGEDHPINSPGVHGLDKKNIAKIGRKFNADYVVRGRIIEYDLQDEHTWELKKKGFLPFVIGGSTRAAFGFAESEYYDNLNSIALWGLAGALIGYNADSPFEPEKTTIDKSSPPTVVTTSTGDVDAELWNTVTWGFAGAGAAHLANHSGKNPEAIVHLRIWVQDTATGDVIWTNRAEVKVAPQSIYGDNRSEELFKKAVNRATTLLVDDFWNKTKAIM